MDWADDPRAWDDDESGLSLRGQGIWGETWCPGCGHYRLVERVLRSLRCVECREAARARRRWARWCDANPWPSYLLDYD